MSIKTLSLEEQYAPLVLQKVDTKAKYNMRDFLTPNEGVPEGISRHFTNLKKGLGVGCGLERLFFAVLSSEESWCEGWVGRDINARIKAAGDFNVLLLKISEDFTEYAQLSSRVQLFPELDERLSIIEKKILASTIPEPFKQYYLSTLKSYGEVYLLTDKSWRESEQYRACWYHKNPAQFTRLQQYAKAGNIIFTLGEMNDLQFLKDRVVSVVDTSNIHDFSPIKLQGGPHFAPRIIWTDQDWKQTKFYSTEYTLANRCQFCETSCIQPMLTKLMTDMRMYGVSRYFEYTQVKGWENEFEKLCYQDPCYLIGFLQLLKNVPGGTDDFMQKFGKMRFAKVKAKVLAMTVYGEAAWHVSLAMGSGATRAKVYAVATLTFATGLYVFYQALQ